MSYDIDGIIRLRRLYYSDKTRNLRGIEETIMRFGDVNMAVIGDNADTDEVMVCGDPNQLVNDDSPREGPMNLFVTLEQGPPLAYDPLTDLNATKDEYIGPVHFKHFNI